MNEPMTQDQNKTTKLSRISTSLTKFFLPLTQSLRTVPITQSMDWSSAFPKKTLSCRVLAWSRKKDNPP